MNSHIIGQVIGFLGLLVGLTAFFQHNIIKFKLISSVGSLLWSLSYFLLKGYTSSAILFSISIRQYIGIYNDKFNHKMKIIICYFFIIISLLFSILTWNGFISLLPTIITIIATISYFFATPIVLRKRLILTDILWFINALILHSYAHLLATILSICINLYTIKKITKHENDILPESEM